MKILAGFGYQLRWLAQTILSLVGTVAREDRLLHPFPLLSQTRNLHSPRRINAVLRVLSGSQAYLEVGIEKGWTLQAVRARRKVGVDPRPRFSQRSLPRGVDVFPGTSDDFFVQNKEEFGLIFLDGLHEAVQTYKDFCNATRVLTQGGAILIDDIFPTDEYSAHPVEAVAEELKRKHSLEHRAWYGDVWKVIPLITQFHQDWKVVILGGRDGSHGQALVCRKNSDTVAAVVSQEALTFCEGIQYSDYFGAADDWFDSLCVEEAVFLSQSNLRNWMKSTV